jgi:hypothetical protein
MIVLYASTGGKWWIFLLCFLLPDISLVGYIRNPKSGALIYNYAHTYLTPAVLGLLSFRNWRAGLSASFIWVAHIGLDRMLGYGLKYPTAFAIRI